MARTPARAAARSTSASTPKSKAAKPLPRRPAPASRPQPGDDFAPLFAALVALCQAHEGARSAPARALLAALAAILDLCRRYLAAPTGSYLMDGCLDTGGGGGFAGLQLVAPPAAAPPAPPRAPQAPVEVPPAGPRSLGEFHSLLASQVLGTIEELGELGDALDGADSEARQLLKPGSGATIASLRVDIEEARDHLRFALCSIAELSAAITGEEVGRSMAAHAAALARIELLSEAERGRGDLAKVSHKSALASFTDWLATPAPPSPQARATVGLTPSSWASGRHDRPEEQAHPAQPRADRCCTPGQEPRGQAHPNGDGLGGCCGARRATP